MQGIERKERGRLDQEKRREQRRRGDGEIGSRELVSAAFQRLAAVAFATLAAGVLTLRALEHWKPHRFQPTMLRHRQPADGESQTEQLEKTVHVSD